MGARSLRAGHRCFPGTLLATCLMLGCQGESDEDSTSTGGEAGSPVTTGGGDIGGSGGDTGGSGGATGGGGGDTGGSGGATGVAGEGGGAAGVAGSTTGAAGDGGIAGALVTAGAAGAVAAAGAHAAAGTAGTTQTTAGAGPGGAGGAAGAPAIPIACGNGATEGGEQCDDGNNVSGDGCSADCLAESCSDGVLNNNETEIDCGGSACDPCPTPCQSSADCAPGTSCAVMKTEDGLALETMCYPEIGSPTGDACADDGSCDSQLCLDSYCASPCVNHQECGVSQICETRTVSKAGLTGDFDVCATDLDPPAIWYVVVTTPSVPGYVNLTDRMLGETVVVSMTLSERPAPGYPTVSIGGDMAVCFDAFPDYSCSYTLTGAEPDGDRVVTILTEDLAGNPGLDTSQLVRFDFTPPALELGSVVTPSSAGVGETVTITAVFNEPLAVVPTLTSAPLAPGFDTLTYLPLGNDEIFSWEFVTAAGGSGGYDMLVDGVDLAGNPASALIVGQLQL